VSIVLKFIKNLTVMFLMMFMVFLGKDGMAASFADTHGFSAYGMSMGNAMSAIVDDWSSVYYNVAGLGKTYRLYTTPEENKQTSMSLTKKKKGKKKGVLSSSGSSSKSKNYYPNEVSLQGGYSFPMLTMDISRVDSSTGKALPTNAPDVGFYGPLNIGAAINLGIFMKMPFFVSSARMGIAMGANVNGSAVNVHNVSLKSHNYLMYGNEIRGAKIMIGLGFGFLKDLFGVGIGVNVTFGGDTSILLDKVAVSGAPQTPYGETLMTLNLNVAAIAGLYFSPGNMWDVVDGLEFGVSYSQENYMSIAPMNTVAVASDGALTMQMNLAIFDYYQPHIIKGGLAYSFWIMTISADVEYQFWSMAKYSTTNTELYGEDGLPKLRNSWVARAGFKFEVLKWLDVSCGYYWMQSVVTDTTDAGSFNLLDNDKHVASVGAKFKLPKFGITGGPIEISIVYQFQYLMPVTVTKDATYLTSENPNYTYGGMVHSVLLGLSMKI